MGSGGGSSQPTQQTVTQSNIPKELMPYAMANLGRAAALTDINQNPWQQYRGQRFAEINPLQQQYEQVKPIVRFVCLDPVGQYIVEFFLFVRSANVEFQLVEYGVC